MVKNIVDAGGGLLKINWHQNLENMDIIYCFKVKKYFI